MSRRIGVALVCLAVAASARADTPSLTIDVFGGYQNLNPTHLATAAVERQGTGIVGLTALFDLKGLGLGVGIDKSFSGGYEPWDFFANVGPVIDLLPVLRLEALGEIGRAGFGSLGDLSFSDSQPTYHTFVGVRPGVSFRLVPLPIRIGVSVPIRWAISNGASSEPDYGVVARVGFEIGNW